MYVDFGVKIIFRITMSGVILLRDGSKWEQDGGLQNTKW